jgi:CheY-like chemotaxis protein
MLSILLLGDADRTEFHDARVCLDRWGPVCEVAEIDAAAAMLAKGEVAPDVIVVAQSFPGQFSHDAIDRLRRLAPLARILGVMGSWCEGEMRSGLPWPATVRTYWHQWPARCHREFGRLAAGQRCSWALPLTATDEERLLVDTAESWPRRQGLVVIRSPSFEMADWLSAACRRRGLATLLQRAPSAARVEGAAAGIFDGSDLGEDECAELERLALALRPAPVVVLLAFPRAEHYRLALSSGAAAVLSKPVAVEDLYWQLDAMAFSLESTTAIQEDRRSCLSHTAMRP